MISPRRVLVFHTAFPGDLVLTVPMIEAIHDRIPSAEISVVVVPSASGLLAHHPAVAELLIYDKRGKDRGTSSILSLARRLRNKQFDVAVVPHRSLRSAFIVWHASIPRRIGFSTSAGKFLLTDVVEYVRADHEVLRNLSLLQPLGITAGASILPRLYPDESDREVVDRVLPQGAGGRVTVALAPGSKWNTKRWPPEYYAALGRMLVAQGTRVVLLGGKEDDELCDGIATAIGKDTIINVAGKFTLLQSAETIRRCTLVVSNDSAPVHLSVAMRTPVLALFGPTVPAFGFAPLGAYDEVVQREGLACRPCSIHGGATCPIRTFVCMKELTPDLVFKRVLTRIGSIATEN